MSEGFFRFWFAPDSLAAATLYNADHSQGAIRLLFVVNPTLADATVTLEDLAVEGTSAWRLVADTERFIDEPVHGMTQTLTSELFIPALSCALWTSEV
ncbi:MAG TPA: hypothetical protein PLN52_26005 [Opitutaceae bacterium]|nr:hypothetical protein [Opitutaceae bacterium]